MQDYKKLVKALRCCASGTCDNEKCDYMRMGAYGCMIGLAQDAADAIDALNRLLDQNTQRCEALRKQLRESQEQYEKNINELEKELSFSESTYEEFQIVAATQNALLAKQLPKRGEWIGKSENDTAPICSNCRKSRLGSSLEFVRKYVPYCEWCGAKMEVQE